MRAEGLEPSSSFEHRLLKPGCLPVPPRPRRKCRGAEGIVRHVVHIGNMRSREEFEQALLLLRQGLTPTDVARATGIPRATVRDWGNGRATLSRREPDCTGHDFSSLDAKAYAYLLGMYLGDGCISRHPRGVWRLRVTLDATYPVIVSECAASVSGVVPGRRVHVYRRLHERCVEVSNYWKHWPCYFPQHGSGSKHSRRIVLEDWQRRIVADDVEPFLRGLIHSDGTRIIATERKGSYVRRAPRYAFSNRSEDILGLFRGACEMAGVHCTRASQKQIAVYSKASVTRLDEFVGPKR
jgi:Homeodomain-like domain